MNQNITHENYWVEADKQRQNLKLKSWKENPIHNSLSLAKSIVVRLFISFVVLPATLIFMLFLLEANTMGLVPTLNELFIGSTELMTAKQGQELTTVYNMFSMFFFVFSWVISWNSPAKKEADRMMDKWHTLHGDKMLPPEVKT